MCESYSGHVRPYSQLLSHQELFISLMSLKSDETIEVGKPLYEIDTEASATIESSDTNGPENPPEALAPTATTTTSETLGVTKSEIKNESYHRTPMIKFLGKEGWALKLSGSEQAVESFVIPPMYGRPAFSEEEMEALLLGGASLEVPGYASVSK